MTGISGDLLRPMKATLEVCPEFESDQQLRATFNDELLAPWKGYVRDESSPGRRVNLVIDLLLEEKRAETMTNALLLLLFVLRDNTDPGNARYRDLDNLAYDFNNRPQSSPSGTLPRIPSSTWESNPDDLPMLFTTGLKELLDRVGSVAKVNVPRINNGNMTGSQASGTAWLVAPGLALTCLHVIEVRTSYDIKPIRDADREEQAVNSVLTFDYTSGGKGIGYQVKALECYDSTLDYALVRLRDRNDYPLHRQGFLRLDAEAPLIAKTTGLYIVQHPKGQPQQISSGFYQRLNKDQPDCILHSAPTEKGTSGAPVMNIQNWSVVALHTGDNPKYHLREATLLRAILSHIQQTKESVYDEIKGAARQVKGEDHADGK